ncbi:flagellum-adhesion glycoprotein [Trypanosoma brucei brucei TREU927]|uniref:Flagellum-adhesion glycoprotein n=1 Tax=Trypanosoma brucei brucei (strain 927/4 GUTat10.1) TaxID=185431 RepID=Q581C1_TRYB2|nr:flagellum-adhesion glycoprotein [Trypanosoma brucei brucei TREU927]AAX78932.1 flagellum-adhesion glycoprotein [Trypanosoma brucei]AAZ13166.1 flagellum-adhesion glycoprotein [Trypanosoma brucei brucei TREU927]
MGGRTESREALAALVAALLLLLGFVSPVIGDQTVGTKVIVNLFNSCINCSSGQADGINGTGRLFKAVGGFFKNKSFPLLLCDVGGGGSTVRLVNKTGIYTVAGNLAKRGDEVGPLEVARFNHPTSVVGVNNDIYVADRDNDCMKRIDADGMVTKFAANEVDKPSSIIYHEQDGAPVLFISDTGNSRIMYSQISVSNNVTAKLVGGFQPGVMQISKKRNFMYVVKETSWIAAVDLNSLSDSDGNKKSWDIANMSCLDYVDALMLTEDENELYYYGEPNGESHIMSLELNSSETGLLCPKKVMEWMHGPIVSLVKVNGCEYYAITETAVYAVREKCYSPTPLPPVTPTPTPGSPPRSTAVAAFRASSFPMGNDRLMHALYSWIIKDVEVAFRTEDFYAVFLPPGEINVPGGTNVSTWTNLTAMMNLENTILITNYRGPPGMSKGRAQKRLFSSPWTWTRMFLEEVSQQEQWSHLLPLCMVKCVDDCQHITLAESVCGDDSRLSRCDGVCLGGIVSSALLGAVAIVLLFLMVVSPYNVKFAFVRLPAFE